MTVPVVAKKAGTKVAKKHAAKRAPVKRGAVSRTHIPQHAAPTPKTDAVKRVGSQGKVAAKKTGNALKLPFDNRYAPKQKPLKSVVTYRHVLAAEFYVGLGVILFHRVKSDDHNKLNPTIVQCAAFIACWVVLFGMTAGGQKPARFSAWLGALILLTLIVKNYNMSKAGTWMQNLKNAPKAQSVPNGVQGTPNGTQPAPWAPANPGIISS